MEKKAKRQKKNSKLARTRDEVEAKDGDGFDDDDYVSSNDEADAADEGGGKKRKKKRF